MTNEYEQRERKIEEWKKESIELEFRRQVLKEELEEVEQGLQSTNLRIIYMQQNQIKQLKKEVTL